MKLVEFVRVLAATLAAISATAAWACPVVPAHVSRTLDHKVWQYAWDLPEAEAWLAAASAPLPAGLAAYRDYANSKTDTDPFVLLARQRGIFESVYGSADPSVAAFLLIESRELGHIGVSSCVELLLMAEHLKFHPFEGPGSEFSAHIFRKGSRLKIFAAFIEYASMGAPSVRIDPAARQELEQGAWSFVAFLHNHPFSFDNPYGDISGTVIPSDPDLMTFRNYFQADALQGAWITNGISTARYYAADVDRLIQVLGL